MSIWQSLENTASSLFDAGKAPLGVVWDIASAPFDSEDDSFASLVNEVGGRGADLLDPIINEATLSGFAFTKTMQGLEFAYREGLSEPVVSASTMLGHVVHDPIDNFDDIFSGEKWGEAYNVAQNRSIGQARFLSQQAFLGGATGAENPDPLDERAYKQMHKNAPFLASLHSGTTDFAARWYLDPGILIGKAAGLHRANNKHRKVTGTDFDPTTGELIQKFDTRADLHGVRMFATRTADALNPFHKAPIGSRIEEFKDFIAPLDGAQIYAASEELQKSLVGRSIAGLLGDANKIEDPKARGLIQNQILAVSLGDAQAALKAKDELAALNAPEIADALQNIAKGSVIDLKAHALGEHLSASPALMAQLQGQIDNIGVVKKAVKAHKQRLEFMLNAGDDALDATPHGIRAGLKHVPGAHRSGTRALKREAGETLPRRLDRATREAEEKAAKVVGARLQQHPTVSTIAQHSLVHVPMKILTFPYLRGPLKAVDALRTPHLQNMVSPHDWDSATTQLDSMMRTYGVAAGPRMELLSKAFLARTETEKAFMVQKVQTETMKAMASHYNRKAGRDDIDGAFIEAVMKRVHARTTSHLAAANGRMYAATMYGKNASFADDALGRAREEGDDISGWRVDELMVKDGQITGYDDVDGVPMSFPVLETQGRNMIPLMDFELIKRTMDRDQGYWHRNAKAWEDLRMEADRISQMKGKSAQWIDRQLERVHVAQDALVFAATKFNRGWKLSVLMRLGYPLRVVADDHMRIWAQLGAMSLYAGAAGEFRKNFAHNHGFGAGSRRQAIAERQAELRIMKDELEDQLSPEAVAAYEARASEIKTLNRKIGAGEWAAKRAESNGNAERVGELSNRVEALKARRDVLASAAGDDPRRIERALQEVRDELLLSRKALKRQHPKKRIGEADVLLPGGYRADGAFAGPYGDSTRHGTSSSPTWKNERWAQDSEDRIYGSMTTEGSYRLYTPLGDGNEFDEARHLAAWADAVNNQLGQSRVARFFIDDPDATPEDFAKWLRKPEQKPLRDRVPHFAHDPEDWGGRVKQLVDDYIPSDDMLAAVRAGRVNEAQLQSWFTDPRTRPNVHGATVMHNLGEGRHNGVVGRTINRIYKHLGQMPTDKLSRSPYFKAIYDSELKELHRVNMAARTARGETHLVQADIEELQAIARKNALGQLKRTLFDVSSHSNAAHFMRFVSPFFAAHQEAMSRWWNIVSDNPAVLRRIQQGFDIPAKLELVYNAETGDPHPVGAMPDQNTVLLMQLPKAWGGHEAMNPRHPNFKRTDWRISLSSFNLILQNGSPFNPGTGPLSQVPIEWVTDQLVGEDGAEVERLARLLNPFAPRGGGKGLEGFVSLATESATPSTARRVVAWMKGPEGSVEGATMLATNYRDVLVKFRDANGREPSAKEEQALWDRALTETRFEQVLRIGQNALMPYSGGPQSEFEVFRQGWRKINELADAKGEDWDWRISKFKKMYGDAYLPMIYSNFENPGSVDPTQAAVGQLKRYKSLVDLVGVEFAGAIVGRKGELGPGAEPSRTAIKYLNNTAASTGSSETFYSYDDPEEAMVNAAIRRGWDEYSTAVDGLQQIAVDMGFASYRDVPELAAAKTELIVGLTENNPHWGLDYKSFGEEDYEQGNLAKLVLIAQDKKLNADPARQDVKFLQTYLQLRQVYAEALAARAALGGHSTMQAASNADLQAQFESAVGELEEASPDFQMYWMPIIDRDPFLREAQ